MREFRERFHKRNYYTVAVVSIILMIIGVIVDNPAGSGIAVHGIMVVIISVCLLLYPTHERRWLRSITVLTVSVYFYALFYMYPGTWSAFVLLCFVPALSILFFDKKLFYSSLSLNIFFVACMAMYIGWVDKGRTYAFFYSDIPGNLVNFVASQIILYFIFYLTNGRIKKQRMYYEEVQQAERMKTTGQLAAAVAHEIRNPLTVVKGFLQYYSQDEHLPKDYKQNFSLMLNELDTAEHVISQFLSISKPEQTDEVGRVDMEQILRDVTELLSMYGILHDNSIELEVDEQCLIAANPMEVKQLFVNLLKNAIEASDSGESVSVKAARIGKDVFITMTDRGRGMTKEQVDHLGTPFYSLKSKGTGLGLMICYNIVERYDGHIHFESEPGEGTTVTVRFPLVQQ
ncbi:HAMP domain-containing sensor histidine kinase [Rossellomorea marisflavi]|uniref:HAMP domain-containing sensor histidine kinase n=1 Tax=Rossellomorea marisflavi TaxID=189381 RepID=UPI0028536DC1|nr:HAMP domain-containing sensor histidine kinase [Rossellomorea marisflavi]MDR4937954.1 HAMP domain-containing sensor histidine kinase [Rossellomorea marisflavi]